ncbi:MAG: DoxX family protein [Aridibacter sp.]
MSIIKIVLKWIFGLAFIFAGANHFINPKFYLKIMPPYLPWHLFLIYLSGIFEIILGIMLLIPKTQKLAAWGLILLLIAVFPANIYMAMNPNKFPELNPLLIYLRLLIQFVLIAWAYWFTKNNSEKDKNDL